MAMHLGRTSELQSQQVGSCDVQAAFLWEHPVLFGHCIGKTSPTLPALEVLVPLAAECLAAYLLTAGGLGLYWRGLAQGGSKSEALELDPWNQVHDSTVE